MAWTSPRTWVAGEVVTAALLNTHLRDNLLDLGTRTSGTVSIASGGFTGTIWWTRRGGVVDLDISATDTGNDGWSAGVGLGTLPASVFPQRSKAFYGGAANTGAPILLAVNASGVVSITLAAGAGLGGVSASTTWVQ